MKRSVFFAVACSICLPIERAHALGDQWYLGIGGGASWLQPNPEQPGLNIESRQGTGGQLFFGTDLDDRSSGQITLYSLGEAVLKNDEIIPFNAVDASVLYRIYDTKDGRIRRGGMSLALYGRFALGYIDRDTDVPLSNDAAVYFGVGGGAELFFNNTLSMRLEGMYHDRDAASGSLQLVARFGGTKRNQARPPLPAPGAIAAPQQPVAPAVTTPAVPVEPAAPINPAPVVSPPTITSNLDADGDAVPNAQDQCPASMQGFPVRANGCPLLDGVLSGVSFVDGSAQLVPGGSDQLDFLANVLAQYPQARIELHAHTDDQGTVRDQAILTRARLRTMGTYMVSKGVRANRLVLRSFGGTRPLYDNASAEGRAGNNRIEVLENGSQ